MRTVSLPSGEAVPALGQGTWGLGIDPARRHDDVAAVRLGLDLGLTLVDTAEMYGEGSTEELVGEAIAGRRDDVFLVSKVYPHNADRRGVVAACERSLRRLRTDRLDLYLLHWRGDVPFEETLAGFADLVRSGKIRHYGVSNLDAGEMAEWWSKSGGAATVTDQVLYNLMRRGVEWDLLPWCRERGVPVMAYSPLEQGRLLSEAALHKIAERRGVAPAQVALAWLLHQDGVIVIPKAGRAQHLRENRAAADLRLSPDDLAELDRAFPPPTGPRPLELL